MQSALLACYGDMQEIQIWSNISVLTKHTKQSSAALLKFTDAELQQV